MLLEISNAAGDVFVISIIFSVTSILVVDSGVNLYWWNVCDVGDRYSTMAVH